MQRNLGHFLSLGFILLTWTRLVLSESSPIIPVMRHSSISVPPLSPNTKPKLVWAKNYAPPFFIDEGPDKGHGFSDEMQATIEEMLPQYHHQTVYLPLPRLNEFWRKKENYCFASMIFSDLPPSTDYMLSTPNVYYLPHGIITRHDFVSVQGPVELSLQTLLTNPNLTMGVINKRNFDATIDALIMQNQDVTRTFLRNDKDGLQGLLNMLLRGRIDYLIDYPFVYHYYEKKAPFTKKIRFFNIQEIPQSGVLGAIACTNNPWGKQIIGDINIAIEQLITSTQYQQFLARWHSGLLDQKDYLTAFITSRERHLTQPIQDHKLP